MVKLLDDYTKKATEFANAQIKVPKFDQEKMTKNTKENPVWVHFGGGNLFRCFHAQLAQQLLNKGEMQSGVVVAETYDDEVINKIYHPYKNRSLQVEMKSDDTLEKELIASVGESIYANQKNPAGLHRLEEIFENPSLQIATFSITEKGYSLTDMNGKLTKQAQHDIENEPETAQTNMGMIANLLLRRYLTNQAPIAMVSTDNFSQNGKRLQDTVMTIANGWLKNGFVDSGFIAYLSSPKKVSFPWSMIDRITPNPSVEVAARLKDEGFEDTDILHTHKHTNIAPFGNTEETHYLVIEDSFPNGRPKLEDAGVIMTDRETVNKADQMKVTACLNPLHTSLAIFGCLLGFTSIAKEVEDPDLLKMIKELGYDEDLPVVVDPKIIDPKNFIDTLINKRLPNKNIPDTPQRIASDTSQKMKIRYGVTLQQYLENSDLNINSLRIIPMVIAGWCRYLMGIDDNGEEFEASPDPLYEELHDYVKDIQLGEQDMEVIHKALSPILSNDDIFGNDLYEIGLGEKIEDYFKEMNQGPHAIREAIHENVSLNKESVQ